MEARVGTLRDRYSGPFALNNENESHASHQHHRRQRSEGSTTHSIEGPVIVVVEATLPLGGLYKGLADGGVIYLFCQKPEEKQTELLTGGGQLCVVVR